MPRLIGPGFLTVLSLAALLASSGQALASHVQCGDVVTRDTTLDSDLIDCPDDGIIIGAAGIKLDLNGHTVDGQRSGTGIGNAGRDRVEVEDGTISGFRQGLSLSGVAENRLRGLTLTANLYGIALRHSTLNQLERNVVEDSLSSISLEASNGNSITRNQTAGGFGIEVGTCCGDAGKSHHNLVADNSLVRPYDGIRVIGSENHVVRNVVFDSSSRGIRIGGGMNNQVERNLVTNPQQAGRAPGYGYAGIALENAQKTLVANNRVSGFYDAVHLSDSRDNSIRRNRLVGGQGLARLSGHPVMGIYLFYSSHRNRVDANVVSSAAIGIYSVVEDTVIEGNLATDNYSGIYASREAIRTLVKRNIARNSVTTGITVEGPSAQVVRNEASDNGWEGIRAYFSPGTVIERNAAHENRLDGILLLAPDGISVSRNTANRNGELGINAELGLMGLGVIDGGRNRAAGNGNPLQCVNVFCR